MKEKFTFKFLPFLLFALLASCVPLSGDNNLNLEDQNLQELTPGGDSGFLGLTINFTNNIDKIPGLNSACNVSQVDPKTGLPIVTTYNVQSATVTYPKEGGSPVVTLYDCNGDVVNGVNYNLAPDELVKFIIELDLPVGVFLTEQQIFLDAVVPRFDSTITFAQCNNPSSANKYLQFYKNSAIDNSTGDRYETIVKQETQDNLVTPPSTSLMDRIEDYDPTLDTLYPVKWVLEERETGDIWMVTDDDEVINHNTGEMSTGCDVAEAMPSYWTGNNSNDSNSNTINGI